jgi:5'-phosphate synthase pdxT subunit
VSTGPAIGVLALQGDFAEHVSALKQLGLQPVEIRLASDLDSLDALIVPGGESTSMANLMDTYGLRQPLRDYATSGRPVWGTCAGLILLAGRLVEDRPEPLGIMDTLVQRNGFGRQVDSFETNLEIDAVDGGPLRAVFIRAPRIVEFGATVRPLATLPDGNVVAARQDNLLVTAFHPELTQDLRMHGYFIEMASQSPRPASAARMQEKEAVQ